MKPQAQSADFERIGKVIHLLSSQSQYEYCDMVERLVADAHALTGLAQQPAPEALREAVAHIATGSYWDDIDGAVARVQAHLAPLLAERDAALAEVARLRDALRYYAESGHAEEHGGEFEECQSCAELLRLITPPQEIARAALEEKAYGSC